MKTFKEFLLERAGVRFVEDGIKVIDTNHSIERYEQRVPGSSKEIENMLKRIVGFFKSGKYKKDVNEFLFYSKKFDQAIIVAYEPDYVRNDPKKVVVLMTILPKGRKTPKEGTPGYIMETVREIIEID